MMNDDDDEVGASPRVVTESLCAEFLFHLILITWILFLYALAFIFIRIFIRVARSYYAYAVLYLCIFQMLMCAEFYWIPAVANRSLFVDEE